ncbi:hypothetical protein [Archangium sp.]|uniref:galactose-binding domain-containing protein n=1 Tax=Archangium sp. TaxID=1872627 RepID=UPI00286C30AC|nr:hypothetical protein [Archangium sp.]
MRIQLAGANFLALAEVQVFATNLAASKPTAQLSTWSVYTSNLAVDSDLDGNFANGSVTHTHSDLYAWWQLDVGASYNIGQVHLWNRADCCRERLSGPTRAPAARGGFSRCRSPLGCSPQR